MSCSCIKIRHIVRLRQMLRRLRRKVASSMVPAGHVAVNVGSNRRRYLVRTSYLNHPIFRSLLVRAEEEYGFHNTGPLALPCDESSFEHILSYLNHHYGDGNNNIISFEEFQRCCHVDFTCNHNLDTAPFLNKAVW